MPHGPLVDAFRRLVHDRPADLAIASRGEGRRVAFASLATEAADLAQRLDRELAGDSVPVGLATGNAVAFVTGFLALLELGLPAVTIDGGLPLREKLELCRRLRVARLLHRDGVPDGDDATDTSTEPLGGRLFLTRLLLGEPVTAPAGTCLVKLTSGSTGDPVASCFTQHALQAGIHQIAAGMEIGPDDVTLLTIPLSHSYGFDNGVLALLALGCPLILEPSRFPAPILAAMVDSNATVLPLVPPLVRALAQTSWPAASALRRVISAGGPLCPEVAALFRQSAGRPVHQFYGSTESGGISFERDPESPAARGTVGHPLPGVDVQIDEQGRVTVWSPANYHGHLGRSADVAPRSVLPGDRGELLADGRLRLLGRGTEIFNVGGRKVSAVAVEEALRTLDGVVDAAVVGVADALRGDRIVAFVVADREPLDTSRIPATLLPREIHRVSELPYTERGKLDRSALHRLAGG